MYNVHESSVVDIGAVVGDFTSIWHFCHVEAGARIGENCNLGQNVYVGNNAIVGNACRIGNSVSVFSHVVLEDFVFCAPFMVFTHIYYPRAAITRKAAFATTRVRRGATIGGNATVVPGIVIGTGAFVAAGAVLTNDCRDWALMVGVPARHVGWVSAFGDKIPLPIEGDGEWHCPESGDVYRLLGRELRRIPGHIDVLNYVGGRPLARLVAQRDGMRDQNVVGGLSR